jgi:hypothetical protein
MMQDQLVRERTLEVALVDIRLMHAQKQRVIYQAPVLHRCTDQTRQGGMLSAT